MRNLRSDLDNVFNAAINQRGVWAVDVRSLESGERLYALNAERLMMPASNMKILTVAAAAEALGWDYRFHTTLEARGIVSGGVLHGDLVIRGGGDPTINSRERRAELLLDEWARSLQGAGIQSVEGRVIGDDQAFDDEALGAGWAWDYLQYGYAAPIGALEFNQDEAALTIAPAPTPGGAGMAVLDAGSGLELVNRTITGPAGSENTIDYRRRPDQPILEVTGTIAAGSLPDKRSVAVVNPTIFFAQCVKDGLAARGVAVNGPATDFDDIAGEFAFDESHPSGPVPPITVIATSQSPPLREIATVLMKVSQNLYAETLLKAMGAARNGLGTVEGGRLAVRKTLTDWHIPDDSYVQYDGSGLSRYNYVTASTLVSILQRLYGSALHREPFMATLPIAGKDGTMETRLRGTRAEGNALAKTGSISNVRALSGYLRTRDGEMVAFSIIANDFVIPSSTIAWIADLGVEVLANFSRR